MARAAAAGRGRAATLPASTPTAQSGIEHVVVVMMENRSFDHMLGWLPGANGVQAGLTFQDHEGVSHATWHLDTFQGLQYGDPDHSYDGGRIAARTTATATAGSRPAPTTSSRSATTRRPTSTSTRRPRRTGRSATTSTRRSWVRPSPTASTCTRRRPIASATRFAWRNLPTIWDSLAAAGVSAQLLLLRPPVHRACSARKLTVHLRAATRQFLTDCAAGDLPVGQLRRPEVHRRVRPARPATTIPSPTSASASRSSTTSTPRSPTARTGTAPRWSSPTTSGAASSTTSCHRPARQRPHPRPARLPGARPS